MTRQGQYIICDIDGVLAIRGDRGAWDFDRCSVDSLCQPAFELISSLHGSGVHVVLMTGRNGRWEPATRLWLTRHEIPHAALFMRPTDDDQRESCLVKLDLFSAVIKPEFGECCMGIIDDDPRVCDAFASIGVFALHVTSSAAAIHHPGRRLSGIPPRRPFNSRPRTW